MRSLNKLAAGLAALGVIATAPANLITNGSFEDGSFTPDGNGIMSLNIGAMNMTGWTVVSGELTWDNDPNPFNGIHATDGIKSLDLTGYHDSSPYGGVAQSFSTAVGNKYHVEFDFGANTAYGTSSMEISGGNDSADFTKVSASGQSWEHDSFDFTATSATSTLTLKGISPSNAYIGLDNVTVTGVVPEPCSMLALGLSGLAILKKRNKR